MIDRFPKHEGLRVRGYARFKKDIDPSIYQNFDLDQTYRIFEIMKDGEGPPIAWIGPADASIEEVNQFDKFDARPPTPERPRAVPLSVLEGTRPPLASVEKDAGSE